MNPSSDFDPTKPEVYIIYVDANNLYGWAMCQNLPCEDFEWLPEEAFEGMAENPERFVEWLKERYGDDKGKGCYVECDLYAPPSIHDKTAYYPLAPVTGTVDEKLLSAFQKEMHKQAGSTHDGRSRLLLQDLLPKKRYGTYYKNLLFYLKKGMRMKKIHRILQFKEKKVMEPNILVNQAQREQATNDADRNSWKHLNNGGYGKCLENPRNHGQVKFASTPEKVDKVVRDPGFDGYCFHSDNLLIAKMKHTSFTFDKPIYLGCTITELAKLHMYEFYYDVLQEHFGWENLKLCMTDTDSLMVEVTLPKERIEAKTANMPEGQKKWDIYDEIREIQENYDCPIDTSTFQRAVVTSKNIKGEHNKKHGYFKSETGSSLIKEFVGLRAKCYSYLIQDDPEFHMRCKVYIGNGVIPQNSARLKDNPHNSKITEISW